MARADTAAQAVPQPRYLLALSLLAAALLAAEVGASRLIAIQHFHHLAPLIISIALLGFGAAGVLVTLFADAIRRRRELWLVLPALVAGPALAAAFVLSARLPLNMLALAWEPQHLGWLAVYALVLLPGFLAGAISITVMLASWPRVAGRIYAADLWGGALGAFGVLWLIDRCGVEYALMAAAAAPTLAAALFCNRWRGRLLCGVVAAVLLVAMPGVVATGAEYKALAQRAALQDSAVVDETDTLMQRLTLLSGPALHAAPGASLRNVAPAPPQWQLFFDGESPVPLPLQAPARQLIETTLGYAPYLVVPPAPRVLIGEPQLLWQAWAAELAGADSIALLHSDAALPAVLTPLKARFDTGIYPATMRFIAASPRRYFAAQAGREDLDLVLLAAISPAGGIAAAQENFALTSEGLRAAWHSLSPTGVLAIAVDLHSLPRDSLRLVNTATALLRGEGMLPREHLAVVRDWHSATLLIWRWPPPPEYLHELGYWAQRWQFDINAWPSAAPLPPPSHLRAADLRRPLQRLLGGDSGDKSYVYQIAPTRDDHPFFHHFFRWGSVEVLLRSPDWRQQLEWGYLLALTSLLVGAVFAAGLLVLPRYARTGAASGIEGRCFGTFFLLGVGFMWVEIGALHRVSLLLDTTAIGLPTVLAAMLCGAGIGSAAQQRRPPGARALTTVLLLAALTALAMPGLLSGLLALVADWSLPDRVATVALLIGVLAVPLGVPLPALLQVLARRNPYTVAWCWAINGFAGVLGAISASLIAMQWGLTALALLAAIAYTLAALCAGPVLRQAAP